MIFHLHPDNPEPRKLQTISDALEDGGVFVFPTDTVYALVADSQSKKGIDQLYDIKQISKNQPFSLLCYDIETVSSLVEELPNAIFQIMKRFTPGPYTFILKANKSVLRSSYALQKNKQIGVRIPGNTFLRHFLKLHKKPLVSTSCAAREEFFVEISELQELYEHKVKGIVDGGISEIELSTILSGLDDPITVLREGKGFSEIEHLLYES